MTKPVAREPLRRNSRANRERILATARQELGRNPDITLEELARAAGVVRRTLFGHFPGREALLEALAEEASEALRSALTEGTAFAETVPAERAFAGFVFSLWPVGDRYRLLLALARRDLGVQRVAEVLAPARATATAILARGQRDGVFHTHLPAEAMSGGLEAMTVALLESVNDGLLEDDGTRVTVSLLIAAGVPQERAKSVVEAVAPAFEAERDAADD
ncbi:TetR family transcriptional regulator [Streptomyces sp. WAC 01325]|uniref:TetR/AcrR family transcriptional regulator n=1 Tax=Streptomyces sp. WAC 01325 TaxID=2203202 RepID=UPI000F8644F6|nr:TetR/AcrR family transcriptional regulator [Streptomyces sp. WAC 01325]RSM87272.1 TetR family transcriptional regulator [Streptomyces sp. WAC 01325]WCH92484.1 TetR/AcrR family transcriptional regulator [Streptomyces moderatus]